MVSRNGKFSGFRINFADLYLNTLVKSPVIVQFGDNTILKVEKSDLGTLDWKHNGNLLSGGEPHLTLLTPRKTELEISNAGPEQAGVYEVFLKEGGCVKRKEIRVQTGLYCLVIFFKLPEVVIGQNKVNIKFRIASDCFFLC